MAEKDIIRAKKDELNNNLYFFEVNKYNSRVLLIDDKQKTKDKKHA
ncbi:hypothetical protein [Prochlorococcus marinus]|nr:hypothetical protein [Prochlorococcus marinus]